MPYRASDLWSQHFSASLRPSKSPLGLPSSTAIQAGLSKSISEFPLNVATSFSRRASPAMAGIPTISPLSETKTCPSPLNRLRKCFSKENKSTPNLIGIKTKRFSEFESYSGRSRGTLGGFSPLPDIGSPGIDGLCLERQKNGAKECVLTQLTKRIGLGIYTRGHDMAGEREAHDGLIDRDGEERETWYMFYPPPPSPSLALEPKDWDSASSSEPVDISSSSLSIPVAVLEADVEPQDTLRLSTLTEGSQYDASNPVSPVYPTLHRISSGTSQDIDIDALILSAETLAEQYRGLLLNSSTKPYLISSYPSSASGISPLPFPSQIPSPLSLHPPNRPHTPKTLRKIKRQHSLRKLIDAPSQHYLPSPTTPTTLGLQLIPARPMKVPTSFTPPPSAKKLTPLTPLLPPPALCSPDFLSRTFTPEPLHPTRLSLAAHPDRSPTPSKGFGKHRRKKLRREFSEAEPPEPPPRESSRGRVGWRKREGEKVKKVGEDVGAIGRTVGKRNCRRGIQAGDGDGGCPRKVMSNKWRDEETWRYGVSDRAPTGGVNEGGEGWL